VNVFATIAVHDDDEIRVRRSRSSDRVFVGLGPAESSSLLLTDAALVKLRDALNSVEVPS